jgi:hypothetical protein
MDSRGKMDRSCNEKFEKLPKMERLMKQVNQIMESRDEKVINFEEYLHLKDLVIRGFVCTLGLENKEAVESNIMYFRNWINEKIKEYTKVKQTATETKNSNRTEGVMSVEEGLKKKKSKVEQGSVGIGVQETSKKERKKRYRERRESEGKEMCCVEGEEGVQRKPKKRGKTEPYDVHVPEFSLSLDSNNFVLAGNAFSETFRC